MRVWLVQRAESTPHDDEGKRRLMRMGILANLLESNGHEVLWWTSSFDHVTHQFRVSTPQCLSVSEKYKIFYLKSYGYQKNRSIKRFIDNCVVANSFSEEIKKNDDLPDVILASLPSVELALAAVVFGKSKGIPVILDVRDLWPDVFKGFLPPFLRWSIDVIFFSMRKKLRLACKEATAITGITEEFVTWGVNHAGKKASDKDISFPMAYVNPTGSFGEESAYHFWSKKGVVKKEDALNVLFMGTFTKSFDFDPIFRAASYLSQNDAKINFIFCGNGAKGDEVKKQCSELPNCLFAGWVNASQIQAVLKLCDIGIAPYIDTPNFVDNVPNKLAEYMSESLAIASSLKHGAIKRLLNENECGFAYDNDPSLLANLLLDLYVDRGKLKSMRESADFVFDRYYDANKIYGSMINYMKDIVEMKNTGI